MYRGAIIKCLIVTTLLFVTVFPAASALSLFLSETDAQHHCPNDVVVWLNLPTHIYHWKGMRWYGITKSGAYVCKMEADENGNRGTRNGQ